MLRVFFTLFLFLPGYNINKLSSGDKYNDATGSLTIAIKNMVNDSALVLEDKNYINPYGESYTVNIFKYYISNIKLSGPGSEYIEPASHLADAAKPASCFITLAVPRGIYTSLSFLLGVDSAHNTDGAQSGDLDPINGMFWTWHSGYIMAKLEGHSQQAYFNNEFEYHIGGYENENSVLHTVILPLAAPLHIFDGARDSIKIKADINQWWKPCEIKIGVISNITSTGKAARDISGNYSNMFSIIP